MYERLSMVFGDYYPNDYGVRRRHSLLLRGGERVELHLAACSVPAADSERCLGDGKYT